MRALAELIMKGRTHATIVAVLSVGTVFFAWIGAAAIALVTLRKGIHHGLVILMWAVLPALAVAFWGDTGPLGMVVGSALVAVVLRSLVSWPWALVTACVSGLLTSVGLLTIGHGVLTRVLDILKDMLMQLSSSQQSGVAVEQVLPTAIEFAGLLGLNNAFAVTGCVMLARWWQALLYNPGGFGEEFRGLRMPPVLTIVLLAAALGLSAIGPDYRYWAITVAVPMVIAGFALVHATARARNIGGGWLALFYGGWLLLDPLKIGLFLLAVADSWINFRGRFVKRRDQD